MTGLVVLSAGHVSVQDLGRTGRGALGIAVNGAGDVHSARTANTLVGNAPGAPLLEVTGSALRFRLETAALLAVTGAADVVLIDGVVQPVADTLVVDADSEIVVPSPHHGLRSYVAVGGGLRARTLLGSVSSDVGLGLDNRLSAGGRAELAAPPADGALMRLTQPVLGQRLFRFAARQPSLSGPAQIDVTAGPEAAQFTDDALAGEWQVSTQSDHVGLRATGPTPQRNGSAELLSRGVPVGAVEVPPGGGLLILLRGRLVTAGYPVLAVATGVALDRLAQARPGDAIVFRTARLAGAREARQHREADLLALARRVGTALTALGCAQLIDTGHLSAAALSRAPNR